MAHPSISYQNWTKTEDQLLYKLVEKYEQCHWESVADELGVSRDVIDIKKKMSLIFTKSIIQHKFYIDIHIEITQKISIFSWAEI